MRSVLLCLVCLWLVDRIEGDWAVLLAPDGVTVDVRTSSLPWGAKEGDCVVKPTSIPSKPGPERQQ